MKTISQPQAYLLSVRTTDGSPDFRFWTPEQRVELFLIQATGICCLVKPEFVYTSMGKA